MIRKLNLSLSGIALCLSMASGYPVLHAQDSTNFPTIGEVIRLDPALDELLDKDAVIEVLTSGFTWTEGPVWVKDPGHPQEGYLLFSDIPNNRVVRWEEGVGASTWMQPSGYTGVEDYGAEPGCNGLLIDGQGQLVSCEHGDRRLSVLTKGGGKRTLVDNYQGKRLNSPNDLCFGADGKTIYFTDPPYGLPKRWDDPLRELDFCGVYRLGPDGTVTLLTDQLARPNGIAFSPDFKTLYVAQSDPEAAIIMAYPMQADGGIGEGRVFYDATSAVKEGLRGLPDGLKIDEHGNLWATGPGGVHVLTPQGKLVGRISTGELTSNCAWGNDGSVLYLTADTYICRIRTKVKGAGW